MAHRHVKLRSGHVLTRHREHAPLLSRPHRQDETATLRSAINDHSIMSALRGICNDWIHVARMSDQRVVDYLSHLVGTGQVHVVSPDVLPAKAMIAGSGADKVATEEMSFGVEAKNLLKNIERLRLKPYDDQTSKDVTHWVKGATIGYGHLIPAADWHLYKDGMTKADADILFDKDSVPFVGVVRKSIKAKIAQHEFDALVILAYNIGRDPKEGFPGSSVVKLVNNPKAKTPYRNLEAAWKAWNKSQGKVSEGLKRRRQCEWDIYSKNIYKGW